MGRIVYVVMKYYTRGGPSQIHSVHYTREDAEADTDNRNHAEAGFYWSIQEFFLGEKGTDRIKRERELYDAARRAEEETKDYLRQKHRREWLNQS